MDRRSFLKSSTFAAAAAGAPHAAASDQVNVGIIGVGGRGLNHVQGLGRRRDVVVSAVCDVDGNQAEKAAGSYYALTNRTPRQYSDLRRMLDAKDIDAVFICSPNHWHALTAIWSCQAGKDVYVEKPVSYNPFESEQMVAAARLYKRVVQGGTQRRSLRHKIRAVELLRSGYIGKLYMARGLCYKRRPSIGRQPDGPAPRGVDWDLFLGPAPMRPFNANRFRYNWHWFWDTGNGDLGNQGIHELDYVRLGLSQAGPPKSVHSTGGKYIYDDDQETPNVQTATWDYGDVLISFEVRGLPTGGESDMGLRGGNFIGTLFYGSGGYLVVEDSGFRTFLGDKREPGESMKIVEAAEDENGAHVSNFLECVRSRDWGKLAADIADSAASADLAHMANISYRTGRKLVLRQGSGTRFVGDEEANSLLTRNPYRSPFIVPRIARTER